MPRSVGIPTEEVKDAGKGSRNSDRTLLKQFTSDFRMSNSAFAQRREDWKKYVRAYRGKPFDDAVVKALSDTDRVLSNFNFSLSTINALIGQDQADRKEARFVGVDKSEADSFGGELMTDLVRHLFLRARGHRHLSRTQLDQLLTGYGWIEVFIDTTKFPFQISARHVDTFKMYVDPRYQADNCGDARYVIHKSSWYVDDVVARWPNKAAEIRGLLARGTGGDTPNPRRATGDWRGYAKGPSDTNFRGRDDKDRIEVSNYQFKFQEPWVAFQDPQTGEEKKLPKDEFDKLVKELVLIPNPETGGNAADLIAGKEVSYVQESVYSCWIAGTDDETAVVLEEPKIVTGNLFTYRCATAYAGYDEEKGQVFHFGLMAMIYDPQLWITKSFSAMIDFIAVQSKGGGFYKQTALVNPASFERDRAKPGAWIPLNQEADMKNDIMPNAPMQFPAVYERILEFAINAIPRLTTVTDAVKGTMTSERSNVLISNLQQHSQMVLNPLFDPMSQLQIDLSVLIARFAQEYLPPATIDRILGDRQCENVTFTKQTNPMTGQQEEIPTLVPDEMGEPMPDPTTGEMIPAQRPIRPSDIIRNIDLLDYDVDVDLGSASATSKQAFTSAMMQTAFPKVLQDAGLLDRFMPTIVKNWPGLPASDAKKLSDELEADIQARRALENGQAVLQAIQAMPPDQQLALMQQLQQQMAQMGVSPESVSPAAPVPQPQPSQPM
jgi:hypothetical protein